MKKTGLFYSFNTRKSAIAAEKIAEALGKKNVDMVNAEEVLEETFLLYDNLILSLPTWFDGELPNYWDEFIPAIEDMNLKGKTFALFGLGNQKEYPENFVDALGIMYDILKKQGATIVGETLAEGYVFESSKALRNGKFVGLALDFDNQKKQADQKIKDWADNIKKEFKI